MEFDQIYKSLDRIVNKLDNIDTKLDIQVERLTKVETRVDHHAGVFKWGATTIGGLITSVLIWILTIWGKSE